MTLIIGIKCSDGLVMAADSMSTEGAPMQGAISRHESNKIVIQKDLLWGASGSVGVKQLVEDTISTYYGAIVDRKRPAIQIRKAIVEKINEVVRGQYELQAKMTGGKNNSTPWTNFIFGVHCNGKFELINVECDMQGEVTTCNHLSTGSGAKTGQALLRRLRNQDWDVRTALRVAYRTMNDAIHVEPGGIGPPIRLATYQLDDTGKPVIQFVSSREMDEISAAVEVWTGTEQEALTNLIVDNQPNAKIEEVPQPSPPETKPAQ